jgi:hypothetical protein
MFDLLQAAEQFPGDLSQEFSTRHSGESALAHQFRLFCVWGAFLL